MTIFVLRNISCLLGLVFTAFCAQTQTQNHKHFLKLIVEVLSEPTEAFDRDDKFVD